MFNQTAVLFIKNVKTNTKKPTALFKGNDAYVNENWINYN